MSYRDYLSLPLVLVFFLLCTPVFAAHNTSEPYDGTVNSFRWLKSPLTVSDVPIHDEDGKSITLSHFNNKIVLLNLWASWCVPCIRELPTLDRLQKRLGGDDFVVMTVSLDHTPQLAREMFFDQLQLEHLKLYVEPAEQLGQVFPVDVLPASFIINRNSQAVGLLRSYVDWDSPLADTLIKRLVEGVAVTTLKAENEQRDQAH